MNVFEYATRRKVRFPFKGQISTEDLWDLSLENLDDIYKTLKAQVKTEQGESLLRKANPNDELLEVKIALVTHIVNVKLGEREARQKDKERRERNARIKEIIAQKQDADLQNKSVEELEKMLDE
mgnify:CR=1 FL=1